MRQRGWSLPRLAEQWWREHENTGRREKPTRGEYQKINLRFRRFFIEDPPTRTAEVARWIAKELELPFYEYYPEDIEEAEALELVMRKRERRREDPVPPSRSAKLGPRARP